MEQPADPGGKRTSFTSWLIVTPATTLQTFGVRARFQLACNDSAPYFFGQVKALASPNYIPTEQVRVLCPLSTVNASCAPTQSGRAARARSHNRNRRELLHHLRHRGTSGQLLVPVPVLIIHARQRSSKCTTWAGNAASGASGSTALTASPPCSLSPRSQNTTR